MLFHNTLDNKQLEVQLQPLARLNHFRKPDYLTDSTFLPQRKPIDLKCRDIYDEKSRKKFNLRKNKIGSLSQ